MHDKSTTPTEVTKTLTTQQELSSLAKDLNRKPIPFTFTFILVYLVAMIVFYTRDLLDVVNIPSSTFDAFHKGIYSSPTSKFYFIAFLILSILASIIALLYGITLFNKEKNGILSENERRIFTILIAIPFVCMFALFALNLPFMLNFINTY